MKKLLLAAATALVFAPCASADDRDGDKARANLSGFQEVPVVSTTGSGRLRLEILSDTRIDYELTYEAMESPVTQAHIHIGQRNVNGGIVLWFCQSATNPAPVSAGVVPQCTSPSGSFSGSFSPAVVQTVATQHFETGNLAEVIDFIRRGLAYGNVHTLQSPGGEIRGQIRGNHGHHGRED
jgi:CHRD domain-containing protein